MLASNSYGKWASRTSRIKYFCKYANVREDLIKELCEREDETEIYTYLCHTNGTRECGIEYISDKIIIIFVKKVYYIFTFMLIYDKIIYI